MKRILILVLSMIILSGCSLIEGENVTEQYVDSASQYINELSKFAEEAPQMAKEAATNPEVMNTLNDWATSLSEKIEQFNGIDVPTIAQDLHEQIVEKNDTLLTDLMNSIENGKINEFVNSDAFQTIADILALFNTLINLTGGLLF